MKDSEQLTALLRAGHDCISIVTFEEDLALDIAREAALELNRSMWVWSVSGGIQDALFSGNPPLPDTESPIAALTHFGTRQDRPICVTLDLAEHLRDDRTLRVLRNLLAQTPRTGVQLVMVDHNDHLPDVIQAYSTRFDIALPDEDEIADTVRQTLRNFNSSSPIEIQISRRTFQMIIRNLRGLTRRQIRKIVIDCVAEDQRFDDDDINHVLAGKRKALQRGALLEYVETPVDLQEIGGLRRLKEWLRHRQDTFSSQARSFGLDAPRGVLMLGIQGAGKSLCAKAIATAWQRPLLRMDVGALYDRYVGESERRLRDALRQAEMMAPIILWIDEIEKAFASAASRSTDGGLSQRMFGTLLTWMQERREPVFVVATANDIEALPPELLRKGRFDEIFFVDVPPAETRAQIFAIHLRKRQRDPAGFDLQALADASDGFSGAEIEQAVVAGLHTAFGRGNPLDTQTLLETIRESPPLSVTMAERIGALRRWAQGRCVPAD